MAKLLQLLPIASWHLEEVVTTTRERSGGQVSFLECVIYDILTLF